MDVARHITHTMEPIRGRRPFLRNPYVRAIFTNGFLTRRRAETGRGKEDMRRRPAHGRMPCPACEQVRKRPRHGTGPRHAQRPAMAAVRRTASPPPPAGRSSGAGPITNGERCSARPRRSDGRGVYSGRSSATARHARNRETVRERSRAPRRRPPRGGNSMSSARRTCE